MIFMLSPFLQHLAESVDRASYLGLARPYWVRRIEAAIVVVKANAMKVLEQSFTIVFNLQGRGRRDVVERKLKGISEDMPTRDLNALRDEMNQVQIRGGRRK